MRYKTHSSQRSRHAVKIGFSGNAILGYVFKTYLLYWAFPETVFSLMNSTDNLGRPWKRKMDMRFGNCHLR